MTPMRPPDDDSAAFAQSSVQPDVDLDASTPTVGNKLAVGLRLNEYEISGVLGEGGFGIVYLAWDHSLQRRLAIKEYMPASLAWRANGMRVQVKSERHRESFEAGLRSFINEAKLLASFDHPSLVKVHRFWQANGTAYMVMPFYEGITLKDALASSDKAPDERWLRDLLQPLLAALAYMHDVSCFHRDIAPDNILLVDEGRPLLLDFGAARRVIGDMTKAVTVILKPGYAPIEQYGDMPGIGQGAWTDIYALGAVLHFAITGQVPRASVTRLVADDYVPLAERMKGRYSDRLLRAIDRMLIVRPEDRPQTIAELRGLMDIELSQESGRIVLPSRMAPDAEPWTRPNTRSQPAPLSGKQALPLPMPAVKRRLPPPQVMAAGGGALALLLALAGWALLRQGEAPVDTPVPLPAPAPSAASASVEPAASAPAPAEVASAPVSPAPPPPVEPASAPTPVAVPMPAPVPAPISAPSAPVPAPGPVPVPSAPTPVPSPAPTPAPAASASPAASSAVRPAPAPAASRAPAQPPKPRAEAPAPRPPAAEPTPRIPQNNARCADIIQRVSIGETLTTADRRILKEECGR